MKQVEVTILGQGYVLGCPDGGDALLSQAVSDVDREMTSIRDAGRVKARERIAVLAALNIAYQFAEKRVAIGIERPTVSSTERQPPDGAEVPLDLLALIRRIDASLDSDGHLI